MCIRTTRFFPFIFNVRCGSATFQHSPVCAGFYSCNVRDCACRSNNNMTILVRSLTIKTSGRWSIIALLGLLATEESGSIDSIFFSSWFLAPRLSSCRSKSTVQFSYFSLLSDELPIEEILRDAVDKENGERRLIFIKIFMQWNTEANSSLSVNRQTLLFVCVNCVVFFTSRQFRKFGRFPS